MQELLDQAITPALLLTQFGAYLAAWAATSRHLKKAVHRVKKAEAEIKNGRLPDAAGYQRLQFGLDLVRAPVPSDPESALSPDRLLPAKFNARLDAAAPGLFTAIGIVGTFLALIIGFSAVDPSEAEASVAPLIASMSMAFLCSLCGVMLSIAWTAGSRTLRHRFDSACADLIIAVDSTYKPRVAWRAIPQLLEDAKLQQQHLRGELITQLEGVRNAVAQSSVDLVEALSPRLEQSFHSIIESPFEKLNDLISDFGASVSTLSDSHEKAANELNNAVISLTSAKTGLTDSLESARSVVRFFTSSAETLALHTEALDTSVGQFQAAVNGLNSVSNDVQAATARYESINQALSATEQALGSAAAALESESSRFREATAEIRSLVERLEQGTENRMSESIAFLRNELEGAVGNITTGLVTAGQQTVAAYEKSTDTVIAAIDGKMTDLTDRLSAELATLASRLPVEVEGLNNSMREIRQQIKAATKSMDDAAKQLAHQTPEALQVQLKLFDGSLAQAMDHFSGTLETWDGHVREISELSALLRNRWGGGGQEPPQPPQIEA